MWFGISTTLIGLTAGLSGLLPILSGVLSAPVLAYAMFGVGVVNILLRAVTKEGIE